MDDNDNNVIFLTSVSVDNAMTSCNKRLSCNPTRYGPVSGVTSSAVRHIPWLCDPSVIALRDTNTNLISSNQTAVHEPLIVTWKPARDSNPESPDCCLSLRRIVALLLVDCYLIVALSPQSDCYLIVASLP
jgi:hypothetical protein